MNKAITITNGTIKFDNVHYSYNSKTKVLQNFTLEIPDKQKVAIVGKSGSGKSTLVMLLLKLFAYEGDIYVGNQNIQDIETTYLRNKILYCNQKMIMHNISVVNNMKYGTQFTSEKVIELLQEYDLYDIFRKLSYGINSSVGMYGNKLSGGMQKIIFIVHTILRIIENDPYVVIWDEPTVGLDSVTRKKIMKMIMKYCSNKTTIIITHDSFVTPYVNKTIDFWSINDAQLLKTRTE